MHKIQVTAPLNTELATLAEVAQTLDLPDEDDRQPDLQYITAIFVSSGINKNGAVFLGSELVKARGTIPNKAVDLEHEEQKIIGQIIGSAFLNRDRSVFDAEKAFVSMSTEQLDELDVDIGITAIIHKARFPEISTQILEGEWMVSMEAYYRDFDVKVGDMIIPRDKAEELGYDKMVGSVVQLKNGPKDLGFHLVGRVLRDILFAGVAIVKNPANPRSVIMEAAALNEFINEESKKDPPVINIIDIEKLVKPKSNKQPVNYPAGNAPITRDFIAQVINEAVTQALNIKEEKPPDVPTKTSEKGLSKETAGSHLLYAKPGICVNYKRYVYEYSEDDLLEPSEDLTQYPDYRPPGPPGTESPGVKIVREHYCNLFDLDCTARPGDATLPDCWRNVFSRTVKDEIFDYDEVLRRRRINEGLVQLQDLIDKARQFKS